MKRYSFQAILVIFLLICSVDKGFSTEYGFTDPINLSCGVSGDSLGDVIARDGKDVYVVCSDAYSNIELLKSTDGGKTFQAPVSVGDGGGNPSMDVDKNGIIYIVYSNSMGDWFTKSIDKGVSFSQPVHLGEGQVTADVAAADNGDIYIASGSYGGFTILKSVDGGLTFNALNTPFINGGNPHTIVVKNGKLHLAWAGYGDGNLYYTQSEDGGATFAAVTNVSGSLGPITGGQSGNRIISLTVDGNSNAYIAWSNAQNLYVSSKRNGDINFVPQRIETTGLHPVAPAMANDLDGHLYLTWYQTASQGTGDTGTFFTRSDPTGETFLPAKRISGARNWTSLAINSEQDALVFADYFYKSIHCTADSCNLH